MYLIVGLGNPDKVYENTFTTLALWLLIALRKHLAQLSAKTSAKQKQRTLLLVAQKLFLQNHKLT